MTDWHIQGIYGEPPFYAQLYPCISLVSRGELLDWWIFKHYNGAHFNTAYRPGTGMIVTKEYYPTNPRSGFQQGNRSVFYDAVKNWQGFDDETKRYYNKPAKYKNYSGYNHYLSLYLKANFPMIIYWSTLEKDASDVSTIPDYVSSNYIPSVHFARNIYWEGHPRKSGVTTQIQDYIASTDFTRGLYPAAADQLLSLGPSGDLVLPGDFSASVKVKARAYRNGNQPIPNSTWTKVELNAETFDPGDKFDSSVNYRYVAPISGYYLVVGKIYHTGAADGTKFWLGLYKDGAIFSENCAICEDSVGYTAIFGSDIIYLTKDQYIELYTYQNTGGNTSVVGTSVYTYLAVHLMST